VTERRYCAPACKQERGACLFYPIFLMQIEFEKPPTCYHCGGAMTFAARISLPPQSVYRCAICKFEVWLAQPKAEGAIVVPTVAAPSSPVSQQQHEHSPIEPDKKED
jgi:hypothetical protein